MNTFQMFFPLALLLAISLIVGWLIPDRGVVARWWLSPRRRAQKAKLGYDIEAVLAHHRQALDEAREAAREAMQAASQASKAASQANRGIRAAKRDFKHLEELQELRSKAS